MLAEKSYLIPELLPKEMPSLDLDMTDSLTLEYRYDPLPNGLISRFIVRKHPFIHPKNYWLTGVVLEHESNQARVVADIAEKHISLSVTGKPQTRRAFLLSLCMELDSIHQLSAHIFNLLKNKFVGFRHAQPNLHNILIY